MLAVLIQVLQHVVLVALAVPVRLPVQLHVAPVAVVAPHLTRVSVKDVVRHKIFGMIWEAPVPLPGVNLERVSVVGFVTMAGTATVTGAQAPTTEVLGLV